MIWDLFSVESQLISYQYEASPPARWQLFANYEGYVSQSNVKQWNRKPLVMQLKQPQFPQREIHRVEV